MVGNFVDLLLLEVLDSFKSGLSMSVLTLNSLCKTVKALAPCTGCVLVGNCCNSRV